ncbi:hypothetical protein TPA0910_18910 [Streptomyces hygroscopicus subsp. sporocinereus]|uniref:Integral membrane protein n=1 Tax=Streptomyces hygroscopicus TaxID=1912 RepID=A0ABQ3TWX1_STRHY|nr:hypothetical protein TPA0910_18910 [Streptomyces hygroscopicus]GLV73040.1 hypothetical protein Shyhy02_10430 [Streptomyces hygroscopicus subsp. hygroscopicus]
MRALARIYPGAVSNETPHSGTSSPARGEGPGPGDGLIRSGVIVFAIGAVATLVTVAPLFLGADPLPSAAYFVCMLMGVGFALAAAGLLRSIAAQRREAAAGRAAAHTPPTG